MPGKARKPARQQETEHHHPVPRKSGKAPGPRRTAGHLDLKSDQRLAHHEGKGHAGKQREQRAEMDGAAQGRKQLPARESFCDREIKALRIAPRAPHQPVEKQRGDINQHERCEDFIGVEARFEEARYGPVKCASRWRP